MKVFMKCILILDIIISTVSENNVDTETDTINKY